MVSGAGCGALGRGLESPESFFGETVVISDLVHDEDFAWQAR